MKKIKFLLQVKFSKFFKFKYYFEKSSNSLKKEEASNIRKPRNSKRRFTLSRLYFLFKIVNDLIDTVLKIDISKYWYLFYLVLEKT